MNPQGIYLKVLTEISSFHLAVYETSYYYPQAIFLSKIGKAIMPKMRCIINLQKLADVLGEQP